MLSVYFKGDLYAWNVEDWSYYSKITNVKYIHDFFFDEVCAGKIILETWLTFEESLAYLRLLGNDVKMMNVVGTSSSTEYWVPYRFSDGAYRNIYPEVQHLPTYRMMETSTSSQIFNESLFMEGEPNSKEEQCISCYNTCRDIHCSKESKGTLFQLDKDVIFSLRYIIKAVILKKETI